MPALAAGPQRAVPMIRLADLNGGTLLAEISVTADAAQAAHRAAIEGDARQARQHLALAIRMASIALGKLA